MLRKRGRGGEPRSVAKSMAFAWAVFLLTSVSMAWAQKGTPPSALPAPAAAQGNSAPVAPSESMSAPVTEYIVSPEDLLDVYVMNVPEVSRNYRVSSNGLLTLPLLPEPIPAAGQTLNQLSHLIAAKFHDAGMLSNASVTVSLVETRLHTVLVAGEVHTPQEYPIYGPTHLLDLLIKAGGLGDRAGNEAIIMRGDIGARADLAQGTRAGGVNAPGGQQSFTLNIRKLVDTGDDTTNILLYPGDRVTIPRAQLIYVMGAVNRPGGYVLDETRQHMTVLKALAMAGDVNSVAKKKRITILRRAPAGPEEKRDEIPVDYKGIVSGQVADVRLMADDILYVPESGGLKAWRTGVNSAVTMVTGGGTALLIYH